MSLFGRTYVPAEILEVILDHLHADRLSLCSSALVQRSWVATTRYHLFDDEIIRQFRSSWMDEEPHDNAQHFLEVCRSSLCTILQSIRGAIVYICDAETDKQVIDALAKASRLRKLVYIDCHKSGESATWFREKFPQVTEFVYNPYRNFGEGSVEILTCFPHAKTLALNDDDSEFRCPGQTTRTGNSGQPVKGLISLRHLRARLGQPENLFRWLKTHPSVTLDRLDLCIQSRAHRGWGPVTHLNAFLKGQARTLRYLSLAIERRGGCRRETAVAKGHETVVNLSPLRGLAYLSFRAHDLLSVSSSLSTLSTRSLQRLEVDYVVWETRPWQSACSCRVAEEAFRLREVARTAGLLGAGTRLAIPSDYVLQGQAFPFDKTGCPRKGRQAKAAEGYHYWQPDTRGALLSRIVSRKSIGQSYITD